ncbi:unnamed protein product [Brassicogethes aeneus]|uniref:Uncharacterized protein n=1 Tax=Brassicogethes aeneus TaxID=1431903 RepID=A0A9P0FMM8_BRAAE|nr:unnamed protein product [Brassicogethes aeneus]
MKLDPKKIAFGGGALFCFCVGFGYYGFDKVLKFGVRDQTALRKRNEVRDVYTKLPFPLDFRVNFFNISNPADVMKGAKPMLKEVGPYCYE